VARSAALVRAALRDQYAAKVRPGRALETRAVLVRYFCPMNLVTMVALALSMSADAFAAALGKGAALDNPRLSEALRAGFIFGTVEAITPVIGWTAGVTASRYISAFDHWIAFSVLGAIGGKMIWESIHRVEERQRPAQYSLAVLIGTAIGTSIDAMAIGVTLALIKANIVVAALAIGGTTFALATLGIMIGRLMGAKLGRIAEAAGGTLLILIGAKILLDHTLGG
jgi:putative Mn2+ efflux pump MntP